MDENKPATHTIDVVGTTGVPIRAVLEPAHLDHKGRMAGLVTFYDRRWSHTPDGQKISSVHPYRLVDGESASHGLDLDGGIPDWKLPPVAMWMIISWIVAQTEAYALANDLRLQEHEEVKSWEVRALVPTD